MFKIKKNDFQNIHYNRTKAPFGLKCALSVAEFFYKIIINFKNFLYEIKVLKEKNIGVQVICVGNLTTGGVGKTPIVTLLANKLSKEKKVAVISRGYGAKISNKNPIVVKDLKEIKFKDGTLCSDEAYQLAKKVNDNVIVIACSNRVKAAEFAIVKYGIDTIILDDGFSNRKIKKTKTILVFDSKMKTGNSHLLPYGPLREPLSQIKRADEVILVDKGDENIEKAIAWIKKFNLKTSICKMKPSKIYQMNSKAKIKLNNQKAIAFCAIGQPTQFFDFAKKYYDLAETIAFDDHHKYQKGDIDYLIKLAKTHKINTFITTQKDETKLLNLTKNITKYSFNVLELENELIEI